MKTFAIPETESYPIDKLEDARKALADVAENGTHEERYRVKQAVWEKHPELRPYEGGV